MRAKLRLATDAARRTPLHVVVYGVAQTKGSTKSFGYYAKNKTTGALILNRHGKPIILTATTNDNAKNKGWSQLVAEGASRAVHGLPVSERGLLMGGVRLTVAFYLQTPKKYQTTRYQQPGARLPAHITKPDSSKLLRSVEDALTNVLWRDDSQVVETVMMKRYTAIGELPRVEIWVEPTVGDVALPRDQPLFEMAR